MYVHTWGIYKRQHHCNIQAVRKEFQPRCPAQCTSRMQPISYHPATHTHEKSVPWKCTSQGSYWIVDVDKKDRFHQAKNSNSKLQQQNPSSINKHRHNKQYCIYKKISRISASIFGMFGSLASLPKVKWHWKILPNKHFAADIIMKSLSLQSLNCWRETSHSCTNKFKNKYDLH